MRIFLWTLISDRRDPYKFCFYCSATHMTSQVLQPKTVNKWYRGRHTVISVHSPKLISASKPIFLNAPSPASVLFIFGLFNFTENDPTAAGTRTRDLLIINFIQLINYLWTRALALLQTEHCLLMLSTMGHIHRHLDNNRPLILLRMQRHF